MRRRLSLEEQGALPDDALKEVLELNVLFAEQGLAGPFEVYADENGEIYLRLDEEFCQAIDQGEVTVNGIPFRVFMGLGPVEESTAKQLGLEG